MLYYVMLLSFHHFMLCSVVSCKGGFSYYAVVISCEGVRCIIIIFGAPLTSSLIFEEKIAFWYSQVLKAVECFGGSSGVCKVKDVYFSWDLIILCPFCALNNGSESNAVHSEYPIPQNWTGEGGVQPFKTYIVTSTIGLHDCFGVFLRMSFTRFVIHSISLII